MKAWWALAVVDRPPAPRPLDPSGLGTGSLEILDLGGCSLVVAALDRAPAVDVDALRAHDAIVRALAESAEAVLPVRFGCVAARADDLASPLRAREAVLREALGRVRGAVQITVRALGGPALGDAPETPEPEGGPGARFLRRRARALTPNVPGWGAIGAELHALLRAELVERGDPRTGERWRAYHLVPRASLREYGDAAARVRASVPDWSLTFGAPGPPYAFAAEGGPLEARGAGARA